MPKLAPNQVPAYRLHKQSGQAIVSLAGRDFLLGKHGSSESRAEYARLTAEWQANGRNAPIDNAVEFTVSMLIARFWEHAKTYYRTSEGEDTGELGNFKQALKPLRRLYGYTAAADFGPLALKAVRQAMIDGGWCRNVVNRQTTRIRQVFKWATESELIPPTVYQGLAAVAGLRRGRSEAFESEPVRPVAEEFVYAIKPHVSRQVWAMIEVQLVSGARPGEVCNMTTGDIDTTGNLWVYTPRRHKTLHHGHTRTIHFGPRAQAILAPLLRRDLQAPIFSPADAEAERRAALHTTRKTPLSCGNKPGSNRADKPRKAPGTRYTRASYLRAVYDACDAAFPPPSELARHRVPARRGKNRTRWETDAEWRERLGKEKWAQLQKWQQDHRWHPHQLRHSAATRLRKQYGLEAARVVLGHRSAAVAEVYAEIDQTKARQIMGEVG